MLTELLALHEEFAGPLRRERLKLVIATDHLTSVIEQHEAVIATLRALLKPQSEQTVRVSQPESK
jgi:hypothetical protein